MFTVRALLATAVLAASSVAEPCGNDDLTCQENLRDQILLWWDKISVQKPIKCQIQRPAETENYKKWRDHLIKNQYFESGPCNDERKSIPFVLKGQGLKIENQMLSGSGKITFLKSWPEEISDEEKNQTCFKFINHGVIPEQIISSFVNGRLEGNSKIKSWDGSVDIAFFREGNPLGIFRSWNRDGNLTKVEYAVTVQGALGHCWERRNYHLVYKDCSILDRTDGSRALAIPLNRSLPIVAGNHLVDTASLADVRDVILRGLSSTDDCILQVQFDETGPKIYDHYITSKATGFSADLYKTQPYCKTFEETADASERLLKFREDTLELFFYNPLKLFSHLKLETSQVDPKTALVLLPEISLPNYSNVINISVFNGQPTTFEVKYFQLDPDNRCHGYCQLSLHTSGNSSLLGREPALGWAVTLIEGHFIHGRLNGFASIQLLDKRWALVFTKDGIIHGPVFNPSTIQILPGRKSKPGWNLRNGIGLFGRFVNGWPTGSFWIEMFGESELHGKFDSTNHTVSGNDIAFIYPDMETVFLGRFQDIKMRDAKESSVLEVGCDDNGLLVVTKFAEPTGPSFYYDPPTNSSYGAGPEVIDPYERKWVEMRPSAIPNSGDGVFLLRDAPANRYVSLYSGFLYDSPEDTEWYRISRIDNTSMSDGYRRGCKKYSLGLSSFACTIDIPPEYDQPGMFQPTLGPKVNHNFKFNNSVYSEIEHPRWGTIQSVTLIKPLKAGDELFTYYGYGNAPFPSDFPWYWETKMAIEKEERLLKEQQKKLDSQNASSKIKKEKKKKAKKSKKT